ncbi:MAG: hypothetical protein GY729_17105, partial [Desulfobacteraceae bacterium]|nr:hypothetical protein [Desulfobacteraceae bacterium]
RIKNKIILGYVWQFLNRCVEWGGLYEDIQVGIPKGSSLSLLLGSFFLIDLDEKMAQLDIRYFRYMDDILILAPTRWKLKKAIRVLNQALNSLGLEKHPEKNVIGRIEKGIDFVGYHFKPNGVYISNLSIDKFLKRINRLYEQNASDDRIDKYVKKWWLSYSNKLSHQSKG